MRSLLQTILSILTRITLLWFRPKIVGITGSVGKTSTKDAIVTVLSTKFTVRGSSGNYNNEIGLPLTVLGQNSGGKNAFVWCWIIIKAFINLFRPYPEVLVLEMGADKPGDISYLNSLVGRLDVAVITDIGISHMEFYSNQQALIKEKFTITKAVPNSGVSVLNIDSKNVAENHKGVKSNILSFGFSEGAALMASDFNIIRSEDSWGANFKVHFRGTVVPFFIPNAIGKPVVYAALAAAGVGVSMDLNLVDVSEALKKYIGPLGRLKIMSGIKRTVVIDDTYNAAPASTVAALDALKQIAEGRKLAAIGNMAELGSTETSGYDDIAAKIVEVGLDGLFLTGKAEKITDGLKKRKYAGKVWVFENSDKARMPIQNELQERDTILVKGSQAARMEKIVKEIMAEPMKAEALLVRQSKKWLNTP